MMHSAWLDLAQAISSKVDCPPGDQIELKFPS